jgi:hypothetical protein
LNIDLNGVETIDLQGRNELGQEFLDDAGHALTI